MDTDLDRGSFGSVLRRLRLAAQMSQEELAERARLSVESISALERGRRRAPYRETVRMLADGLGLSPSERAELSGAAKTAKSRTAATLRYDSGAGHVAIPNEPDCGPASVTARRNNLPASTTTLIGREADLSRLQALVEKARLVTITGAGGIGKTRVALELARVSFSATDRDTWFVDLAPLSDQSLVVPTLAAIIGLPSHAPTRPVLEAALAYIADTPMLIVIDNCEHLLEEVGVTVAAMLGSCANLRIVTTSREALRIPQERIFRLPPLSIPPEYPRLTCAGIGTFSSVALFIERATAHDSTFTAVDESVLDDIAAICRRLDGLPFAIELAAVQTPSVSTKDLRAQLQRTFKLLTQGHRGSVRRQTTLDALIEWSYNLLSETEQSVFRRLAAFAGGWTLDAAQAVCSDEFLSGGDIVAALSSLVGKSLVVANHQTGISRYRFLESTRLYALDKLSPVELERVLHQQTVWVAQFADDAYRSAWSLVQDEWQASVVPEVDNVRLALTTALDKNGDIVIAARIAGGLITLWRDAGLHVEGRRWIEAVLDRMRDDIEPAIAGRVYVASAMLESGKRIVEASTKAIQLFSQGGDSRDSANAYSQLSIGLWQAGHYDEALHAIETSDTYADQCGIERTRRSAESHDLRAQILLAQGLFGAARMAFEESYGLFDALADDHGMARNRGNLAELEFACAQSSRALELVSEAAAIFTRIGATSLLATARANAAAYCLDLGLIDRARQNALESFQLARRTQNTPLISIAIQHLSMILAIDGRPQRAALLIGYVDRWFESEGYQRERSEQRTYEILCASLASQLREPERAALMTGGSRLTEEQVTTAVTRLFLDATN